MKLNQLYMDKADLITQLLRLEGYPQLSCVILDRARYGITDGKYYYYTRNYGVWADPESDDEYVGDAKYGDTIYVIYRTAEQCSSHIYEFLFLLPNEGLDETLKGPEI